MARIKHDRMTDTKNLTREQVVESLYHSELISRSLRVENERLRKLAATRHATILRLKNPKPKAKPKAK